MDDFGMFNIPVMSVDHYQALGLKRENDPNIDDIQNAYRHLALQWHPERNKGTAKRETAALKFIEINEAYKVLMDKKMRESKEAAKGKKSKKDERAMSPSADSMNPDGRSRSRPRWSAAALMSRAMVSGADEHKDDGDRQSARDSFEAPRVSMAPSHTPAPARSTFASPPPSLSGSQLGPWHSASQLGPQHTGRSRSRSPGPRTLAHSREPSPAPTAIQGRTGPETPITAPTPTRVYPENSRASYNTVRSPPAVYSLDQDVRLPRYLKGMSDVTSEIGSESSYFNGHSVSVAGSSSSASTHIPDDWLFPIYLSLEDLYTCKTHRFRINRHLLTGQTKEVFVDVSVQPNWRDGTQLRCKGLGNEREGLPPQDVIFIGASISQAFLRDPVGYDIYARLEISLVIALGGGSTNDEALLIKGVDGREIVVEVPPPVVRHGSMTRIKGAGMPKHKTKDGSVPLRGDLILEWCVLPPDKPLSEDAMAELREALGDQWLRDEEE
ncbi:DnaJ domain-containing protein [Rhizoctonia solani AG-1 IA]|uniref:DnaJ domain-containing protein n=1 Tax=Thanatephorus cucumeris (strain AG1-IA) TaxID=983506 RepID=L8X4Y7_THACA|nr:DnaJ domain-containing protein [Rhizoctonia solani AG-1 IA]